LRIRVSFARQSDHEPSGLEVRISDLLGVQRETHRESPLEFVVPGLAAGEYVVAAGEDSSIGTTMHAKVPQAGRETVVDIALESVTKLQVHWKSTDGTPIVSVEPEQVDPHRSLVVYASRAPVDDFGPLPGSVALAVLDQLADSSSSVGESRFGMQRTHARRAAPSGGNASEASTGDLFGELLVPAAPPFFVSAWSSGAGA
jgi:hypothetical protein